ncbi:MAG: polysaccharide biosynthesis tyrosine autokinase [Elusimicrobia bacterium]|nr:polysaccharide biosynthesis tyrosine autokinase [Elusimicrobiota bacterium]
MEIELSLNDYWRILRKRKWVVAGVVMSVAGSVGVYTQLKVPLYRAQAVVKFEAPQSKLLESVSGLGDPYQVIPTQLRVLESQNMSERVAKRLNVAPGVMKAGFRAEQLEGSNMILISVTGPDPVFAADMANAVVDSYVERDLEDRSAHTRTTLQDVVKRRDEVGVALGKLQGDRKHFLEGHQTAGLGPTLAGALLEAENRRKELLKKFTPIHPDILSLDERITALKARLSQNPAQEQELQNIDRDIRVNDEVYVALSKQMEEAKIAMASLVPFVTILTRPVIPTAPFYPNKPLNYMIGVVLGSFLGLLAAFLLENLDISISTIEEIEKGLGVPVLGIIPHFGTDHRWGMIKTHILRRQRYPMEVFRSQLVFQHRSKSPFIEVYHSLRANIQSQLSRPENMVLTFTSTGVAEGKTLTAVNFALAAAHSGMKTLLVGADLRRPVVHRIFGLPKGPGLVEVLTGKIPFQDAVRDTVDFLMGEIDLDKLLAFPGIDHFKVMTGWTASGGDLVNVLSSPELPKVIEAMRAEYDLVIFDCPPVLLFVDPMIIGPHTDGVVMVYKAGKMARKALRRAKDQIVSSKSNIIGVVLNDMSATDMEPRYGYYYDYGHYARKEGAD